jgi:hypothetical protein
MRNENTFGARKGYAVKGTLPRSKVNKFRRNLSDDERRETSRSSPVKERKMHLTISAFSGRDRINSLFARAGIKLTL